MTRTLPTAFVPAPYIPADAPFTPEQRVWLDLLLAADERCGDDEQSDRCQAFSHKSILLRPEGRFEPHTFTCIEGRHAGMGDSHR